MTPAAGPGRATTPSSPDLCATWGGGGMPLIPVTAGETVDERWSQNSEREQHRRDRTYRPSKRRRGAQITDLHGPGTAQLVRIVVDLERKPTVQTCQGLSEDDPWHLSYLAVLGDVSPHPHRQNTWNDLRPDLTFQDVLTIRGVDGDGSASGLLTLLRDFTAESAIELSRSKLTGGLQASYNKGLAESSRFEWAITA